MLPDDIPFSAVRNSQYYSGVCSVKEVEGGFELESFSSALYLYSASGTSDIRVQMRCGKDVTFRGVPNGILPISVKKIYEEGSTTEWATPLY